MGQQEEEGPLFSGLEFEDLGERLSLIQRSSHGRKDRAGLKRPPLVASLAPLANCIGSLHRCGAKGSSTIVASTSRRLMETAVPAAQCEVRT